MWGSQSWLQPAISRLGAGHDSIPEVGKAA